MHPDKTGGTSVEEALTPYLAWDDVLRGGTTFGKQIEHLYGNYYSWEFLRENGLWKHSTAEQIKQYVGDGLWNSMYKFATVRDPMALLISLYYYKNDLAQPYIATDDIEKINKMLKNEKIANQLLIDDPTTFYLYKTISDGTMIDGFIKEVLINKLEQATSQISRLRNDIDFFDINEINQNWSTILNNIGIKENVRIFKLNTSKKPKNVELKKQTISLIKEYLYDDYHKIDVLKKYY
jgi:hypothetical protein